MPDPRKAWADSAGRSLADYPRPSVAVDTAVLTVPDGASELHVVLVRQPNAPRGAQWSLPGTFLHPGETLSDAVLRSLREKAGIEGLAPRQLGVLDDPKRDHRGWVVSVAHVIAVPWQALPEEVHGRGDVQFASVPLTVRLPWDHAQIVSMAVEQVRGDYLERPDPAGLLPRPFTMLQLQRTHEAVAGRRLPRDTFRRHMTPLLVDTGTRTSGSVGKPAALFVPA